jgi:hypothetical protein
LKNSQTGKGFKTLHLIYTLIEIIPEQKARKAARNFASSIAAVYGLSTSKVILPDLNNDFSGPDVR